MREKYETLSAVVLRDLAKSRGIKGTSGMKKAEVIEAMLAKDEEEARGTQSKNDSAKKAPVSKSTFSDEKKSYQTQKEEGDSGDAFEKKTDVKRRQTSVMRRAGSKDVSESATNPVDEYSEKEPVIEEADFSPKDANGILEVMSEGFGFIRCENYLPGENDVYVAPAVIRKHNLKTGDIVAGKSKKNNAKDKFGALYQIDSVNNLSLNEILRRPHFENLIPVFPDERIRLERPGCSVAMRLVDLISPIGKGQRGMIVSQPKAGKTTLLKEIAKSVKYSNPEMHLIVLLIDERPEEVTDIKEAIEGENAEVIYSTFDELPEHHKRVSEMVIERAKRLVEQGSDVMILLDSITRLARAYNLTVPPSGRTLSGGLDPAALHMPKRFFGAARNMRGGGSLTILATALVDTGSKMDDVVFEEFKGTGNMELVLDRKLSEKRIFPAIDIAKSGTRREDLLLNDKEQIAVDTMRRGLNGAKKDEAAENILNLFSRTKRNEDVVDQLSRHRIF